MGNTSSAATSQNASKCNSCSQSGLYFSFGKKTDANFYALIKGKQRRVYVDSKGKYYNENYKMLALTSTKKFNKYYLITINDFNLKKIDESIINTYEIPIGKTQVEAIKIIDNNNFWITSEDEKNSKSARLLKLK